MYQKHQRQERGKHLAVYKLHENFSDMTLAKKCFLWVLLFPTYGSIVKPPDASGSYGCDTELPMVTIRRPAKVMSMAFKWLHMEY